RCFASIGCVWCIGSPFSSARVFSQFKITLRELIEDFLDTIGVSFEAYCKEMTGGWLFGYVDALRLVGVPDRRSRASHRGRYANAIAQCFLKAIGKQLRDFLILPTAQA
ncbi:MAG: hypothetical protein ACREPR_24660, partial [Brasilonema sp.]